MVSQRTCFHKALLSRGGAERGDTATIFIQWSSDSANRTTLINLKLTWVPYISHHHHESDSYGNSLSVYRFLSHPNNQLLPFLLIILTSTAHDFVISMKDFIGQFEDNLTDLCKKTWLLLGHSSLNVCLVKFITIWYHRLGQSHRSSCQSFKSTTD